MTLKQTILQFFYFKNTKIAFTDQGKGSAIVLLHGFLENQKMWDVLTPTFIKKYRVITVDLLGHGETECRGYVHAMEDNADIVFAVLQQLKIKKTTLIGHSMGGYVALAFAELYPENVRGLVLLNSTSRADSPDRQTNRDRAIKAVKQNFGAFISLAISNLFSEDNRDRLAAEIELVKKEALKTPLQGVVASLMGMKIRKDREVILHFAPFPILLVLGQKDPVLPYQENCEQIEGTAVELLTFPDGHMSTIENTSELLKNLEIFFKKLK